MPDQPNEKILWPTSWPEVTNWIDAYKAMKFVRDNASPAFSSPIAEVMKFILLAEGKKVFGGRE